MKTLVRVGLLFSLSQAVMGVDLFDQTGDNNCATSIAEIFHGSPQQVHDLEAVGGVNDVDFIWSYTQPYRSYEFSIVGPGTKFADLVVTDINGTPVYSSLPAVGLSYARAVRWMSNESPGVKCARVTPTVPFLDARSVYAVTFRETTLYCPRYNNSGTQSSVLIIQDTRLDNNGTCDFGASFRNEAGTLVGVVLESMGVGATRVIALPGVPGLAGTKGSAQIAHTCGGTGGIKAKLVALEPSTGFSFDTICSQREP